MELGAEGILANTAIAQAQDPMAMAEAFKHATICTEDIDHVQIPVSRSVSEFC